MLGAPFRAGATHVVHLWPVAVAYVQDQVLNDAGYIRDFIRLNDATTTAREFYDRMLELYPDRANPGSLWSSAAAAKAET
jgi:hypothetical protein